MASLKEIRNRISSIGETIKITSAMKMVSVSKLRKAQRAITIFRPYSEKMQELIESINSSLEEGQVGGSFVEKRDAKKVLLISLTSNKGLAGAFNVNIAKTIRNLAKTTFKGKNIEILTIGKKGFDLLKSEFTIYENRSNLWDSTEISFDEVKELANKIMKLYLSREYDEVYIVYNHFINAGTQSIFTEQYLPISFTHDKVEEKDDVKLDFIFEPGKEQIVKELIPKSLRVQLYKALLDSLASEHGARMTSMHKATDNATELKGELTITYNKARQAAITNELIEIVAGAQAI